MMGLDPPTLKARRVSYRTLGMPFMISALIISPITHVRGHCSHVFAEILAHCMTR